MSEGADGQNGPDISKLRGVNLGAWLVLEKWMVPDVLHGWDGISPGNPNFTRVSPVQNPSTDLNFLQFASTAIK